MVRSVSFFRNLSKVKLVHEHSQSHAQPVQLSPLFRSRLDADVVWLVWVTTNVEAVEVPVHKACKRFELLKLVWYVQRYPLCVERGVLANPHIFSSDHHHVRRVDWHGDADPRKREVSKREAEWRFIQPGDERLEVLFR